MSHVCNPPKSGTKKRGKKEGKATEKSQPVMYAAALRYLDGSKDFFHVKNADSIEDARALVLAAVVNVKTLLISPLRWSDPTSDED
ncbi:MAG: hypothetical protein L6Q55_15775 [Azonexus sp.]|jgi:hypothetical protein|nr:hypothetical protein [Azonexus sp.]MCK6413862.1 hypothetical protein [Azonexus sp.]